jgi:glycosyltransferase-like protein
MSTRALRIGLLMHSLNPRGGVVHTLELADALVARGHAVTVFAAAQPGQSLFRPTLAEVSIAPLPTVPQGLVPMVGARMAALADHLRQWPELAHFDVLHSQDSITANALATLQDEGRIPGFVRTVHHLDHFDEPQLSTWQTRGVRSATQVYCVSALWQAVLARDWSVAAERVPNGVNLLRYTPHVDAEQAQRDAAVLRQLGVQAQGPVWLAVGGVEARKNTVRLLQAFTQVAQALASQGAPAPQLVIAGGASLLEHDAYAREFNALLQAHEMAPGQRLAQRVRLTGTLPDAALPALYRRASALAMVSLREGFGLAVLEALACGTPAIASRIAPFTEHLHVDEVLWADPIDADDIARALWRSLDPAHTIPVLRTARQVCERMSWAASAERHESLYRLACAFASSASASASASLPWPLMHEPAKAPGPAASACGKAPQLPAHACVHRTPPVTPHTTERPHHA